MKADEIYKIAVIGAGAMGAGIALSFAQAGLSVGIVDLNQDVLEACLGQIESDLDLFREFGLLTEEPQAVRSRVRPFLIDDLATALNGCDFVVEAIPEILEMKRQLFAQLDSSCPGAILASNTSSMTITSISEDLTRPERVVGAHYFYPAHIMPLVEIHRGKKTGDAAVETTRQLMLRVGKKPILVQKEIPGFIVNRIQGAYNREINYLIDEGVATPQDIDMAAKASFGFRLANLGPLEIQDLSGLDIILRSRAAMSRNLCNATEPSSSLAAKVAAGQLGLKSGKGWYDYQGRSRAKVMEQANRKLLRQLIDFNSRQKEFSPDCPREKGV